MKRLLAPAATVTIAALCIVALGAGSASAAKSNRVTATLTCNKGITETFTVVANDSIGNPLGQTVVACDANTKRDSETILIPVGTVATSMSFDLASQQALPYSASFPAGFTLTVR